MHKKLGVVCSKSQADRGPPITHNLIIMSRACLFVASDETNSTLSDSNHEIAI